MPRLLLALLLSTLPLSAGCALVEANEQSIPFETLEEGATLRVQVSGTAVFRDRVAWAAFWHQWVNAAGDAGPMPPPDVDFSREMLVAVMWGGNPHAGCNSYVEAVRSVTRLGRGLVVEAGPLPDLGPCRAVVHPLQIIRLERTEGRVTFAGHVPRTGSVRGAE